MDYEFGENGGGGEIWGNLAIYFNYKSDWFWRCLYTQSEDIADSIIAFAQIEEKYPQLVIVDIPEQKKYCHPIGPITKEDVKQIAQEFKEGKLNMTALR